MFNKVLINKDKRFSLLGSLAQPVHELFYIGETLDNLLSRPKIAIVGSRKVTPYGRQITRKIAGELAEAGVVVISGLALGVDSVAHQAVIDVGGQTIAVLPSGVDRIYPASHHALAQNIVRQGGVLLSEYPPHSGQPMKYQFIARNRIIAGLSDGILITEAAINSGSLHTAEFALEQGKEVFSMPGNVTSATSEGTNNLIKNGATPVTTASDILEALGITPSAKLSYNPTNSRQNTILLLLGQDIHDIDILLHMSGLSTTDFQSTITELEINGVIQEASAGHLILAS